MSIALQMDASALESALQSGRRATSQTKTAVAEVVLSSPKKRVLQVSFLSAVVSYSERFEHEGASLKEPICLDQDILYNILKGRNGTVHLAVHKDSVKLSLGRLRADLQMRSSPNGNDGIDLSDLFKKPHHNKVDITALLTAPDSIRTSLLRSIKDHVGKTDLSAVASWKGHDMKILLSDHWHGVLLKAKTEEKYDKAELRLPVDAFLLTMEIEGNVYLGDTECVVHSRRRFMRVALKETSNRSITIDMVEAGAKAKYKTECLVTRADFSTAMKSCNTIADKASSITLSLNKRLTVSMEGVGGSVAEQVDVREVKGKIKAVNMHFNNISDIINCAGGSFRLKISSDKLAAEWGSDGLEMLALCSATS